MASLDVLFPLPQQPQTTLHPQRWPGATDDSAVTLIKTLKDNHTRWHVFFNDKGYHNHTAHHLLAAYGLGADAGLIEAAYASDSTEQRKAYPSPGPIDANNFAEHLGDEDYYNAYMKFFSDILVRDGMAKTFEDWIFSPQVNVAPADNPQPAMLTRFMEGLLHPLIHTGNGAEFQMLGVVAEGLAQTCVHKVKSTNLYPAWVVGAPVPSGSRFLSRLNPFGGAVLTLPSIPVPAANGYGLHALTILAKLIHDPHTSQVHCPVDDNDSELLDPVLASDDQTQRIRELAEEWGRGIDMSKPNMLEAKIGELSWMNAILYGVGGWSPEEKPEFKADFFLMHLVTSSLFIPSLSTNLRPDSQKRLLVAYFAASLATYVARGRPKLDIRAFFESSQRPVDPPGPRPTPSKGALHPRFRVPKYDDNGNRREDDDDKSTRGPKELDPNAWLALANSALFHPEAHVTKTVRTLAHNSRMYGSTPRGAFAFLADDKMGDGKLKDAEFIDGTLFVRTAEATLGRVGWTREGEDVNNWDRL